MSRRPKPSRPSRWRHPLLIATLAVVVVVVATSLLVPSCRRRLRPLAELAGGRQATMIVTAYCACGSCCGWRRNWLGRPVVAAGPAQGRPKAIGIGADGSRVKPGVVAADIAHYPFGTRLHVPGYGVAVVRDTGGDIIGPARLDLFFPRHRDALAWGRRQLVVTVYD